MNEEMIKWIDGASYEDLLRRWRNEPAGSEWFQGEVGHRYVKVMNLRWSETQDAERVAASKRIGWECR